MDKYQARFFYCVLIVLSLGGIALAANSQGSQNDFGYILFMILAFYLPLITCGAIGLYGLMTGKVVRKLLLPVRIALYAAIVVSIVDLYVATNYTLSFSRGLGS